MTATTNYFIGVLALAVAAGGCRRAEAGRRGQRRRLDVGHP